MQIVIDGIPVSWKAHGGYGKRSFNPRFKEREYYRWQIRAQLPSVHPYRGAISLSVTYFLPIPRSTSGIRKRQMLGGTIYPIKRPDIDNLNKFLCDCIKEIVFEDDSQVVQLNARKAFADRPRTLLVVEEINLVSQ